MTVDWNDKIYLRFGLGYGAGAMSLFPQVAAQCVVEDMERGILGERLCMILRLRALRGAMMMRDPREVVEAARRLGVIL